ncbi:hypothetical protein MSAN_02017900 [Mycena sanguinolenta]|uniref:Uncharacterized protein n=1 Tax=Mycena sanguinolenta TaxID=230812 RepID=A0A8H7CNK9_9AGAR|nr:hypothetical protein MSAN_02017900 [Mycena sanguinolenta]
MTPLDDTTTSCVYEELVPHSFIDLFYKLFVPELKALTVTTSRNANPFVLPALTSLAARSEFPLESLHIVMYISTAPLPVDTLVPLLWDLHTLTSLHWTSSGLNLAGLVEALKSTATDHTILPNLIDISLGFDCYDGLLPAFADMVTSRRASSSRPPTVASLRHFHLEGASPCVDFIEDFEKPPPSLSRASKTANEEALARLEELLTIADSSPPLRGSLDFPHFDQKLALAEQELTVEENFVQLAQVDGENLLHYNNDELA